MHQAFDNHLQYYSHHHQRDPAPSPKIQAPLSPRSALRSLQEPSSPSHHESSRERKHGRQRPSFGSGGAPMPALPLPPRKSSLIASRHLPLPSQPVLEDGRFFAGSPASSPSLFDNSASSSEHSSPAIAPHGKLPYTAPRASYGGPHLQHNASLTPSLPHRHSYSSLSTRSVPSVSDGSSGFSIPVSTPDEHGHLAHAPMAVYHSRAPSPLDRQHRDDNPFAYSVDFVEPSSRSSVSSSRSSLPYIEPSQGQRQRYGSVAASHQWPRSPFHSASSPKRAHHQQTPLPPPSTVRQQRPARSVDDYLSAQPGVSATKLPPPRPSLPSDTSALDGRVVVPMKHSSSSMSHRSSLPSLASSEERGSSAMSIHRLSHPSPTSTSPRGSNAVPRDTDMSSIDAPSKRPRGYTATMPSGVPVSRILEAQRRSRSAERPKATAMQRRSPPSSASPWSSTASSTASSPLASRKPDHAEVMAKLNRKMKERIAAKKVSATATAASASGLAAAAAVVGGAAAGGAAGLASSSASSSAMPSPSFSLRKYRGDSVASSVPSTPATSSAAAVPGERVPSARPGSPSFEEDLAAPPPRSNPIGIESLLSAAAINDGAHGGASMPH
ncbi:hypothetical protein BDZ90DRAFT_225331 [Jaminaea rosea]|uniref:Uncharacterized protein n=1 Tax=Jaminaea rosea TaxID=1569628 RepID=A0A316UZA6_9BASI|nr:hypothetical protein BDZ90DRAFT_225331 [Jaminaea rosea]PWN30552.1 hypothetical protein BDZ90DRAFT_225331 [Jaminaea rosea]